VNKEISETNVVEFNGTIYAPRNPVNTSADTNYSLSKVVNGQLVEEKKRLWVKVKIVGFKGDDECCVKIYWIKGKR
jgi:hypothetical protein